MKFIFNDKRCSSEHKNMLKKSNIVQLQYTKKRNKAKTYHQHPKQSKGRCHHLNNPIETSTFFFRHHPKMIRY